VLVVKLEVWKHGNPSDVEQIGDVRIINEGTGTPERGNYRFEVKYSGAYWGKPGSWKAGRVAGYDRKGVSPYHLVLAVLERAFGIGAGTRACRTIPEAPRG
jgi:hypothetical protein